MVDGAPCFSGLLPACSGSAGARTAMPEPSH